MSRHYILTGAKRSLFVFEKMLPVQILQEYSDGPLMPSVYLIYEDPKHSTALVFDTDEKMEAAIEGLSAWLQLIGTEFADMSEAD